MPCTQDQMAARAAQELQDGFYVNLGIGIPTQVANHVPDHMEVWLQSENGMMGIGPFPHEDEVDPDLINAGKQTVTGVPGHSFFSSADSFAMIRGGHIDLAILGAMEVSQTGDLANWIRPDRGIGSIGGAADIARGAKKVFVAMEHTTKDGEFKIVKSCNYPLTGAGVVHSIFTDVAVIRVTPEGLVLEEAAPGWTPEDVQAITEPTLTVSPDFREMALF